MKNIPLRDFGWNERNAKLIAAAAGKEMIRFIGGLVAKDQANRYSLLSDWHFPRTKCDFWGDAPAYSSSLFWISPIPDEKGWVRPVVRAYESSKEHNICDGATFSPDSPKGVLDAAIMHDPAYYKGEDGKREYEKIAEHCGVDPEVVRKWFDNLFPTIVEAAGGKVWQARAYYRGIRTGYPVFDLLRPLIKLFCCAVACAMLASGCMNYEFLFDRDEPYVAPVVEKVDWYGRDAEEK